MLTAQRSGGNAHCTAQWWKCTLKNGLFAAWMSFALKDQARFVPCFQMCFALRDQARFVPCFQMSFALRDQARFVPCFLMSFALRDQARFVPCFLHFFPSPAISKIIWHKNQLHTHDLQVINGKAGNQYSKASRQ